MSELTEKTMQWVAYQCPVEVPVESCYSLLKLHNARKIPRLSEIFRNFPKAVSEIFQFFGDLPRVFLKTFRDIRRAFSEPRLSKEQILGSPQAYMTMGKEKN